MLIDLQEKKADSKSQQIFVWAILLIFGFFVGMKYAQDLTLVQALGGWSPLDWVAHQLSPDNFKKDFPSGISAYRMSSLMQLYVSAARLGLDLEALMPWMIHFEVLFLGFAAAILFRALVPQSSYIEMAIFVVLVVEGSARSMELARFAGGFYQGLYYNVADGLRFLGLAALFRGRIKSAALLLGVGFTVHPVMVGMACVFAAPYVLLNHAKFPVRNWLAAGAIFLVISGIWIFSNIESAEVASGGIPSNEWVALVRMFTFHWFPVDIGVFTGMHERYALPLLCLVAVSVVYLPKVVKEQAKCKAIAWGIGLLAVLAIAGILISMYSTSPLLIKLALHRASDMLIIVCLVITVTGLIDEVLSGRAILAVLSGSLLISPVLKIGGGVPFPAFLTIGLLSFYAFRAHSDGEARRLKFLICAIAALLISLSLYYLSGISKTQAYLGSKYLWAITAVALLGFMSIFYFGKRSLPNINFSSFVGVFLLFVILIFAGINVERKMQMPREQKAFASDYLAVQRWAQSETMTDALFMVDPTIYYGWRDFSQRSSFGNLREWLHTAWLYDSKTALYLEGLTRFSEFEIDIKPYKEIRPSIEGFRQLSVELGKSFYMKNSGWFGDLSARYKIDYLVVQKRLAIESLQFEKVYENDHFTVYRLRG